MANCQHVARSPSSPELARLLLPTKTIFDGTKLSVDGRRPKTTTGGRKSSFQLFSIDHKCTIFSPTFAPVALAMTLSMVS
jgi:hypothetical protein